MADLELTGAGIANPRVGEGDSAQLQAYLQNNSGVELRPTIEWYAAVPFYGDQLIGERRQTIGGETTFARTKSYSDLTATRLKPGNTYGVVAVLLAGEEGSPFTFGEYVSWGRQEADAGQLTIERAGGLEDIKISSYTITSTAPETVDVEYTIANPVFESVSATALITVEDPNTGAEIDSHRITHSVPLGGESGSAQLKFDMDIGESKMYKVCVKVIEQSVLQY